MRLTRRNFMAGGAAVASSVAAGSGQQRSVDDIVAPARDNPLALYRIKIA